MPSPFLDIRDMIDGQKQQEAARSQQIADFSYAANRKTRITVDGSFQLTEAQQKRHFVLQLDGGTIAADFTVDMFDTKERTFFVVNATSFNCMFQNSAGGGSNKPFLFSGTTLWLHYDGSTFIELGRKDPLFPELVGWIMVENQGFINSNILANVPSGAQEDDLIITTVHGGDNQNASPGITSDGGEMTIGPGSGANSNGTLASMHTSLWYHVFTGSSPFSFLFSASNSRWWTTITMAWRNMNIVSPMDVAHNVGTNGGTFNMSATAAETNEIGFFATTIRSANVDQSCLISLPSDATQLENHRDSTPSDDDARYRAVLAHKQFVSAGATGTQQLTYGGGGGCSLAIGTIQRGATQFTLTKIAEP